MNQKITVIDQHPLGVLVAFQARRNLADLFQLMGDLVRDRLDLARVRAGADDKIIGKGCGFANVQNDDIARLLRFGRMNRG